MEPVIALVLFVGLLVAWFILPGGSVTESLETTTEAMSTETMSLVSSQQA